MINSISNISHPNRSPVINNKNNNNINPIYPEKSNNYQDQDTVGNFDDNKSYLSDLTSVKLNQQKSKSTYNKNIDNDNYSQLSNYTPTPNMNMNNNMNNDPEFRSNTQTQNSLYQHYYKNQPEVKRTFERERGERVERGERDRDTSFEQVEENIAKRYERIRGKPPLKSTTQNQQNYSNRTRDSGGNLSEYNYDYLGNNNNFNNQNPNSSFNNQRSADLNSSRKDEKIYSRTPQVRAKTRNFEAPNYSLSRGSEEKFEKFEKYEKIGKSPIKNNFNYSYSKEKDNQFSSREGRDLEKIPTNEIFRTTQSNTADMEKQISNLNAVVLELQRKNAELEKQVTQNKNNHLSKTPSRNNKPNYSYTYNPKGDSNLGGDYLTFEREDPTVNRSYLSKLHPNSELYNYEEIVKDAIQALGVKNILNILIIGWISSG
jgi:hypothetical protein